MTDKDSNRPKSAQASTANLTTALDLSWSIPDKKLKRRLSLKLQSRLASEAPVPIATEQVLTVGDLVRLHGKHFSGAPPSVLAALLEDKTPIDELIGGTDQGQRITDFLERANIPAEVRTELSLSLGSVFSALVDTEP